MMNLLLILAVLGLITSTIYTILAGLGALRFAARRRGRAQRRFSPPVSLLKPLHGAEPELEEHLESFFRRITRPSRSFSARRPRATPAWRRQGAWPRAIPASRRDSF